MYTALLFEVRNSSTNVSAGELLYRLLEHWVLLAQNLIESKLLHLGRVLTVRSVGASQNQTNRMPC